jgi:thiol-disulfide isomerase/thioredoxin
MKNTFGFALTIACFFSTLSEAEEWKLQPLPIQTRWAASVNPTNALPEYPRPQMVRAGWQNLNSLWRYAITEKDEIAPDAAAPPKYDGRILVPYPLESALSGVQRRLLPSQLLWYQRTITQTPGKRAERTLLHFGAVDWRATVFINGEEVGTHSGGYQNFSFDITDALKAGRNELVVKVYDPTDEGSNPHGRQTLYPQGPTPTSGIWQTVWLETVPQTYIESLVITPDVDRSQLNLQVNLKGSDEAAYTVQAIAKNGRQVIATQEVKGAATLKINHPRLWSPDDPFLYDLQVRLLKNGKLVDEVNSYFGLRKIEVKKDAAGVDRIFLNNQYTYNLGALDEGFWPEGLYTAPTDAALQFDIQALKAMGFNTIHKSVKIEPARWYYHCDRLGMLVWQDLVSPGKYIPAKTEFEKENRETLAQLHNDPSIITWVLIDKSWDADFQERLAKEVKQADPSRLLYGESKGTANWLVDDVRNDQHPADHPGISPVSGKALASGINGNFASFIESHVWDELTHSNLSTFSQWTPGRFAKAYAARIDELKTFEAQGLSGSVSTLAFDVEREQLGLMTYDRAVIKIPVNELRKIHEKLIPATRNYAAATVGFSAVDATTVPEEQQYAARLVDYQKGNRNLSFLRKLTLMAIRQDDQTRATEVGNELVGRLQPPYSKDDLTFIYAITRTSDDQGFRILRAHPGQIDAMLGKNQAVRKINAIIDSEEIEPYLSAKDAHPDWDAIEKKIIAKYGPRSAEKVLGARMVYCAKQQDWTNFGKYYVLYFNAALSRSEYHINDLSMLVFEHVTDSTVLDAAIKAEKYNLDTMTQDNPADMDTYANLLYKAGRTQEAIQWQEKADMRTGGHDQQIAQNLQLMKAGKPTWLAFLARAIEMTFTAVDGREVDLAKLRGKVVLIDFWATWCIPCREELPKVKAVYDKYHDDGFEVVGISSDVEQDRQKLINYCRDQGYTWPQYFDGSRGADNQFAVQYNVHAIPASFLLGKDGVVVLQNISADALESAVRKLLGLSPLEGIGKAAGNL